MKLNIRNGSITGSDIEAGSIYSSDLHDNTVTSTDIANNTITSEDIRDTSITGTDIAPNTITSSNIRNYTITSSDLASGSVTNSKLALTPSWPSYVRNTTGYVNDSLGAKKLCLLSFVAPRAIGGSCHVYKYRTNWYITARNAHCEAQCFQ